MIEMRKKTSKNDLIGSKSRENSEFGIGVFVKKCDEHFTY